MANTFTNFQLLAPNSGPSMYMSSSQGYTIATSSGFSGVMGDINLDTNADGVTNTTGQIYTVSGEIWGASSNTGIVIYNGSTFAVTVNFLDIVDDYTSINATSIANIDDSGYSMEGDYMQQIYTDAYISGSEGRYYSAAAIVQVRFYANSSNDYYVYYAGPAINNIHLTKPEVTPITYITTKSGSGNHIVYNYGVYKNPGAELLISPSDFSDSDLGYGGEDDYFDVSPGSISGNARIITVNYNIQDSLPNTTYSIELYSKSTPTISSTVTGKWHIYDSIDINVNESSSSNAEIILSPGEEAEFSISTSCQYGGTYNSTYITWDYTSGDRLITLTKERVNTNGDMEFTVETKDSTSTGTAVITFYGQIGTNTEKSYCTATLTINIEQEYVDITTIEKIDPEEGEDIYLKIGDSYDVVVGVLPYNTTETISTNNWATVYNGTGAGAGGTTYLSRKDPRFRNSDVAYQGTSMCDAGITIEPVSYAPLGDYTLTLTTNDCTKTWAVHVVAGLSLDRDYLKSGTHTITKSPGGKFYVNVDSYSSLSWQAKVTAGQCTSAGISYTVTSSNNILSDTGVIDTTQISGTATITASAYDAYDNSLVTVSWEVVFEIDSDDYSISASNSYTYEYDNLSPTKYITVSHGSNVTDVSASAVTGGDSAITLTKQSNDDFKFAINCTGNPTHGNSYTRRFKFTAFDARGISNTFTTTVTITHSHHITDPVLSVTPSTLVSFNPEGGSKEYTVTCNHKEDGVLTSDNWSVESSDPSVFSVTINLGDTFTVSVGSYTGSSERTATISVFTTNGATSPVTRTVKQSGIVYADYIFTVTPSSASILPNGNEDDPIILTVECSHTEDGTIVNDSWTVTKYSGSDAFEFTENTNGTVSVEVGPNTADDPRTITLQFTASGHSSVYVTITQDGLAESFSSSSVLLDWDDTSSTVDISSQGDWSITPNDTYDWISISPLSGSGNDTIRISTDLNTDDNHNEEDAYYDNTDSRTAIFTTATGKTLTVTQSGHIWTPYFNASNVSVQCNETSATIQIRSDYKWIASIVTGESTAETPSVNSSYTHGGQNAKAITDSECVINFGVNLDEDSTKIVKVKFLPDTANSDEDIHTASAYTVTITQQKATYSISTSQDNITWEALKNYSTPFNVTSSMAGWYIESINYSENADDDLIIKKTSNNETIYAGSNHVYPEGTTNITVTWTTWTNTTEYRTASIVFANAGKPTVTATVYITQTKADVYIVHVLDSNFHENPEDLVNLKNQIENPTTAAIQSVNWGSNISVAGGTYYISMYVSPGENQAALHLLGNVEGITASCEPYLFTLDESSEKWGYLLTITISENLTVNRKLYSVKCAYTGDDRMYKEFKFTQEASSYTADFRLYGRLGTYNNDGTYSIPVYGGKYDLILKNIVSAQTEDYLIIDSIDFTPDLAENTDDELTLSSNGVIAPQYSNIFAPGTGLKAGGECKLTVTIYSYQTKETEDSHPDYLGIASNRRAFGLTVVGHSKSKPNERITIDYILPSSATDSDTERYRYSVQVSSPVTEPYRGILNVDTSSDGGYRCYCFTDLQSINNGSTPKTVVSIDTGDILDSSTSDGYTYYNVMHVGSESDHITSTKVIPFTDTSDSSTSGFLLLDDRFTLIDPTLRYARPTL